MSNRAAAWAEALTSARVEANERWYQRGRRGEGRLELEDAELAGAVLTRLRGARLIGCDLTDARAESGARLDDVEAIRCSFERATLDGTQLDGARIEACRFEHARASSASFTAAWILGARFEAADLTSSDWTRARLGGCSFAGAKLVDASFQSAVVDSVDFRGADLGQTGGRKLLAGATFRRCDFRGAAFAGRSVAGATFEDCAFHGVKDLPELGNAGFVRADLSLERDAPIRWVAIPGGPTRLGLTDAEAQRFAAWAAARARRVADEHPDALHGYRDREAIEDRWGNAEYLLELLAFARPAHEVELAPFRISAAPVTVAEYGEFMRETGAPPPAWPAGSRPEPGEPITGVSWDEAVAYASWRGAALPSEAQWERAARGRDAWWFPWGNEWGEQGARVDADPPLVDVGARPALASPEGVGELVTAHYEWVLDELAPYPGADRVACGRLPAPPGGWWGTRVRRGGPLPGLPPAAFTRDGVDASMRLRDTTFRLVLPR